MSGGFELREHTADIGILATGDSFSEALAQVARGMFSVIAELDTVCPCQSIVVSVTSSDYNALVVDWLNELLYRFEVDAFLPAQFEVVVAEGNTSLEATCQGEPVDPNRHLLNTVVKAATYHGLKVSQNHQWQIQVILDV